MTLVIRPYHDSDAKALLKIHRDAVHNTASTDYDQHILDECSKPVNAERITKFIAKEYDIRIMADLNGKPVGYGELAINQHTLCACYVASFAGRKGVGTLLVKELERIAREHGLTYLELESSITAVRFYRSCGYAQVKEDSHILDNGHKMACVIMRKDL